jgi:putative membrane protein
MLLTTLAALAVALQGGAPPASPARQAPLDDATIVAIFAQANTYDIETGTLGTQKGSSAEVKSVGASLVRDHKSVLQQATDLAKKLGVTPTPPKENPFAAMHAKAMTALKAASGKAFDAAFLDNEIAYHQALLDAFSKTILPAIKNAELKAFVEKVAPAFQAHLDMCKATKTQLKL